MSLYISTQGSGPSLVFLHGWGMNSSVWEELAAQLSNSYTVSLVDLPGHGRSELIHRDYQIEKIAAQFVEAIPQESIWIGWSLGGLIALQIAHQYPESVKAVVMVASTPRFVQGEHWPHAVDPAVFESFAEALKEDYQATLKHFIAIQAMGTLNAKAEARKLRERILRHNEPQIDALRGGLRLLQQSDLRQVLAELSCPIKLISGRRDTLAPLRAAKQLDEQHAHLESIAIQGAAHAPFISHPDEFLTILKEFIERHV